MLSGKKIVLGILLVVGLVLVIIASISISSYNGLVNLDETIDSKYAEVLSRYQARHDTIEQMVQVVDGLQEHEIEVYEMITDARTAYANALLSGDPNDLANADALESLAVSQLLAVIESNPQITVSGSVQTLMYNIENAEGYLSIARRDYNESIEDYNKAIRRFPGVIFASLFNFEGPATYWKINDGATDIPNIDFGD